MMRYLQLHLNLRTTVLKNYLTKLSALRIVPGANVDRAMQSAMRTWSAEAPKLGFRMDSKQHGSRN